MNRRRFLSAGLVGSMVLTSKLLTNHSPLADRNKLNLNVKIGHHFWNWDHAWNDAKHLDIRLRLTKETGYDGFEAKPHEIGVSAELLKQKDAFYGVQCAAIGGSVREAIDYAYAAGSHIVRSRVAKEETQQWVEYAAERNIIIVVHNHLGNKKHPAGAIETREDLLRYLDERPGVYAGPDTGHLALCGSDPAQTIRDLGQRCRYIHLKDIYPDAVGKCHAAKEKFCELGTGALDLAGVLEALQDIDYTGWIMVERDNRVADYVRSARNMRQVLQRFGL